MSVLVQHPFSVPDEAEEVLLSEEDEDSVMLDDCDDGEDIDVETEDEEEFDLICPHCNTGLYVDTASPQCPQCNFQFKLTKHGLLDDGFIVDQIEYEDNFEEEDESEFEEMTGDDSETEYESEIDYCESDDDYVPKRLK